MTADGGNPARTDLTGAGRTSGRRRGTATLIGEFAEGTAELIRQEMRLVRLELDGLISDVARDGIRVVVGSVLLLVGALAVLAGLILVIGEEWMAGQFWLAALIVGVIAGVAAGAFAVRGARRLSPSRLVPGETVATLTEDSECLKPQLTSDATSR